MERIGPNWSGNGSSLVMGRKLILQIFFQFELWLINYIQLWIQWIVILVANYVQNWHPKRYLCQCTKKLHLIHWLITNLHHLTTAERGRWKMKMKLLQIQRPSFKLRLYTFSILHDTLSLWISLTFLQMNWQ